MSDARPAALDELRATLQALHHERPFSGDPREAEAMLALLRLFHRVGRADLPLARLFEGHVDALQIVARYAPDVADEVERAATAGALCGVWNAAWPGEPLCVEDGELNGGKAFASGAGLLDFALAGADTPDGNRLLLIDLAASAPEIDRDWWRVVGMQRSHTHRVRWRGAPAPTWRMVGAPGDYAREPWFSGGALRFVAAHAGGVAGLFDRVRDHLLSTGRSGDTHQKARLADLYIAADLAAAAVRAAATAWFSRDDATRVAGVAAARLAVADQAERAMALAQAAVGVQAMFEDHPLATHLTDLMVYLRQPAPDAARARVGAAAGDGTLIPEL